MAFIALILPQALKDNNEPYADHGIEVMYRFASFDPFSRSKYFGISLDLGQFERFRRIMHSPPYATILNHHESTLLSCFEVTEHLWKQRVLVVGSNNSEEHVFEFTMIQRLGGLYDGYWFTQSLVCDDNDWTWLRRPNLGTI